MLAGSQALFPFPESLLSLSGQLGGCAGVTEQGGPEAGLPASLAIISPGPLTQRELAGAPAGRRSLHPCRIFEANVTIIAISQMRTQALRGQVTCPRSCSRARSPTQSHVIASADQLGLAPKLPYSAALKVKLEVAGATRGTGAPALPWAAPSRLCVVGRMNARAPTKATSGDEGSFAADTIVMKLSSLLPLLPVLSLSLSGLRLLSCKSHHTHPTDAPARDS